MAASTCLLWFLLTSFPHESINGRDFIRPEVLGVKFGLSIKRSGNTLFLQGPYGKAEVSLSPPKEARINGRVIPLGVRLDQDRDPLLPASGVDLLLTRLLKKRIYWDFREKNFFVLSHRPSIRGIWTKAKGDSLLLQITFWKALKPEIRAFSEGTEVWLPGGFYPGPRYREVRGGGVDHLEILHCREGVWIYIFHDPNTFIARSTVLKDRVILWFKAKKKPHDEIREEIRVVVLDPGHGGKDPGAIGPRGRKEKDIVLAIAKRVKRILDRETPLQVVLTRDRDVFVPLGERAKIANDAGGDLFVSIHCNYARRRHISGVETYFLSEAKTEWERAVAAFENAAIRYEIEQNGDTADILKYVLMDLAQNHYLKESQELAGAIHQALIQLTGARDRRVRQAGFYVLHGPFMPSVLVEVGFISNRSEERKLSDPRYQERIARGIAEGIKAYIRQRERQAHRGF